MDANTLNNIASQPLYVLIFVGIMAFLFVMHRLSLASAVQAETIKSALSLAATGQMEANRLRDETNKQNDRWLAAFDTMNERFIMSITGQTGAINRQGTRLDAMDNSVSILPALASVSAGTDAKVDLIVAAIQANGVDIQAVNRKLGYMGVDLKTLAQYATAPTEAGKAAVRDIATAPVTSEQPAPATTPQPGDEIQVTGTVTGTVALTPAVTPEPVPA